MSNFYEKKFNKITIHESIEEKCKIVFITRCYRIREFREFILTVRVVELNENARQFI